MPTVYDLPFPGNTAFVRSENLSSCIQKEIIKKGNVISFADYMDLALYHPMYGYYNSPQLEFGAKGDFTTAPEVSNLFGKCLVREIQPIISTLGPADILEIGAGSGKLACDLLLELKHNNCLPNHYYIYEISPALRKKQQTLLKTHCHFFCDRISWLTELPKNFRGVVIGNEVLDALPVHTFVIDNELIKERSVIFQNNKFTWKDTHPPSPEMLKIIQPLYEQETFADGYRSEVNVQLENFVASVTNSVKEGIIFWVDYGYGRTEYYHPERKNGTLTCFYHHIKNDNPFIYPGLQDITAHVNFTQVIEAAFKCHGKLAGYTTQANFLLACGLIELAQEEEKNLSPHEQINFHHGIKVLTLPTEMGERIKVMAISKNFNPTLRGFKHDRRREL